MTTAALDTPQETKDPGTAQRVADFVKQAAHATHEAGLLKTLAADAVEDGMHTAKRAITRGLHELEDFRDDAAHRMKRAPLKVAAGAFGLGIVFGMTMMWLGRQFRPDEK